MSSDKIKILIAEDEKMLLKVMTHFLEKKGYEIIQATDGDHAISQLKTGNFNLIITDINMPYASGMEIIHLVRNEMKLTIPVIVLTSVGLEKTALNAFEIGASEFITKPFSLPLLAARIEKLLQTHK